MDDFDRWLASNDQYLADALAWLRARLERFAAAEDATTAPASSAPPPPKGATRSLFDRLRMGTSPRPEPAALPSTGSASAAEATATVSADEPLEPVPALVLVANRFGLSTFERNILLLCAAMELDTRIAGLCARAQRDPAKPYPTFALALTLFEQPTWDALSPERPLRHFRLIELELSSARTLTANALRVDERILNFIKGLNHVDDRLAPLLGPLSNASAHEQLPASQRALADEIVRKVRSSAGLEPTVLLQLLGPDSTNKQTIAQAAARELGLRLYRLAAETLPASPTDLEALLRLWQRESRLMPIALYLDAGEIDRNDPHAPSIRRWLNRAGGVLFFDTRESWPSLEPQAPSFDIGNPTPVEQREAWSALLGAAAADQPQILAGQFDFNLATIERIARTALNDADSDNELPTQSLWRACLASARPALDQLAQCIVPKASWQTLKLPKQDEALLRQLTEQVRARSIVYDDYGFRARMSRGLGISALFAGESGTGKTMAAEVIANELGLLLYRVDLSSVVSKYIGETEKSLRRLFDAAEHGAALLFFDEADALFGKRSEVKDSHDRYANIEVNYLLQRMEAYRGLAILATNTKSALDSAFTRRLRFVVNFPFPSSADRKQIWESVYPDQTPREQLDYERLAKLNLTGGSIHNIALNSAFLAARDQVPVSMPLVLSAARAELRKLEKPINEADFRWSDSTRGHA